MWILHICTICMLGFFHNRSDCCAWLLGLVCKRICQYPKLPHWNWRVFTMWENHGIITPPQSGKSFCWVVSNRGGKRSGSYRCRGMEGARGPLLRVKCELGAGPETLSFEVEFELRAGPETLSFRVECKFNVNPGLSPWGWTWANLYVEFVAYLRHSWCCWHVLLSWGAARFWSVH